MPSHSVHRENTRKRLGKDYSEIHKLIDNPFLMPFLRSKHRVIFHDAITPFLLANILARNDPAGEGLEIILAAISHYIDDYRLPEYNTAPPSPPPAPTIGAIGSSSSSSDSNNNNNNSNSNNKRRRIKKKERKINTMR